MIRTCDGEQDNGQPYPKAEPTIHCTNPIPLTGLDPLGKGQGEGSWIMVILKQAENGGPLPERCRKHGISSATFSKRGANLGCMVSSLAKRLIKLENENSRLKSMYAEERLKSAIIS